MFHHSKITSLQDIEAAAKKGGTPMCKRLEQTWDARAQKHKSITVCSEPSAEYPLTDGGGLSFGGCRSDSSACVHKEKETGCGPVLGAACDACVGKPTVGTADASGKLEGSGVTGYGCKLLPADGALCLDESITKIGDEAFMSCGDGGDTAGNIKLTSANLPGVTSISNNAFRAADLTAANMPKLESVGKDAFSGTPKLTHVNIPATLTGLFAQPLIRIAGL